METDEELESFLFETAFWHLDEYAYLPDGSGIGFYEEFGNWISRRVARDSSLSEHSEVTRALFVIWWFRNVVREPNHKQAVLM
jgi:hypothetical protein